MHTLPLGYVLALTGWTRDLHPLDVRHAWRTIKTGRLPQWKTTRCRSQEVVTI